MIVHLFANFSNYSILYILFGLILLFYLVWLKNYVFRDFFRYTIL